MSLKTQAELTTDNDVFEGYVSPDQITPTNYGAHIQNIIDSMIPASVLGGLSLSDYILSIAPTATGMSVENPFLFRAAKNVDQVLGTAAGANTTEICFEDDSTAPNFDNSNCFFGTRFVAPQPMTKIFGVQGVKVFSAGGGATDTYRVRVLLNGAEVDTTVAVAGNSTDIYGSTSTTAGGMTLKPLVTEPMALAAGDEVTFEVVQNYVNATTPLIKAGICSNA